jgi:hypothetical protein
MNHKILATFKHQSKPSPSNVLSRAAAHGTPCCINKLERAGEGSAPLLPIRHDTFFNPVILTDSTDPERSAKGP